MEITIEKLIGLLNRDLEREYSAAIQYINHAAVMTGSTHGELIMELEAHANEKIQYAMILSDQIHSLGGTPGVKVGKILTSNNNEEMLQQDLESQEEAIKRYKTRIEQAGHLNLFLLAQQLRSILDAEKAHIENQKHLMGR